MRDDAVKKFTEKPRSGKDTSRFKAERHRGNNPKDYDALPRGESMRTVHIRHWGGSESRWSDKPLAGFLRKSIGRQWNKVYSEIREQISKDSKSEQDILSWLRGQVELNPTWVGKVPHSGYVYTNSPYPLRKGQLYVDLNGIIRASKNDPPSRWYAWRAPRKEINQYEEYRQLSEGTWFWVRYINLHPGMTGFDVVLNKVFHHQVGNYGSCHELEQAHGEAESRRSGQVRLAVEKRQCSRKTIHDEGLNNL